MENGLEDEKRPGWRPWQESQMAGTMLGLEVAVRLEERERACSVLYGRLQELVADWRTREACRHRIRGFP